MTSELCPLQLRPLQLRRWNYATGTTLSETMTSGTTPLELRPLQLRRWNYGTTPFGTMRLELRRWNYALWNYDGTTPSGTMTSGSTRWNYDWNYALWNYELRHWNYATGTMPLELRPLELELHPRTTPSGTMNPTCFKIEGQGSEEACPL
jgi:hypothetical protein